MGVAFALLDELLQLLPERPDADALKEVDDVLREIRHLAQTGLKIVKLTTGLIENPDVPGNGTAEAASMPRSRRSQGDNEMESR